MAGVFRQGIGRGKTSVVSEFGRLGRRQSHVVLFAVRKFRRECDDLQAGFDAGLVAVLSNRHAVYPVGFAATHIRFGHGCHLRVGSAYDWHNYNNKIFQHNERRGLDTAGGDGLSNTVRDIPADIRRVFHEAFAVAGILQPAPAGNIYRSIAVGYRVGTQDTAGGQSACSFND